MTNYFAGLVTAAIWIAFPHPANVETTQPPSGDRQAAESTTQQQALPDHNSELLPTPNSSGQPQSEAAPQTHQFFVGGPDASMRLVEGKSVMVSWSENNDELRGFSRITGEWTKLSIKVSPKRVILPVVGDLVAAVKLDDAMTAYSGTTGRWDTVQLSKNSQAFPSVDSEVVYVHDGGHHYTFAASSGRWTSPTDPELQSDHLSYQYNMQTHRQLERQFADWLNSSQNKHRLYLSATFTGGLSSSSSRQIILHSTRQSAMAAARAKLKELEATSVDVASPDPFSNPDKFEEANSSAGDPFATPARSTPNLAAATSRASRSAATSYDQQIAQLSQKLTQIEDECQNVATIIRNTNKVMTDTQGQVVTVPESGVAMPNNQTVWQATNKNLQALVDQAFEIRQEIHTLETRRMQHKLQTIQSSLDARQKNRERIVQRRTEELLDPDGQATRWDFVRPGVSSAPKADAAVFGTTESASDIFNDLSSRPERNLNAEKKALSGATTGSATPATVTTTELDLAEVANLASQLRSCRLRKKEAEDRIDLLHQNLNETLTELRITRETINSIPLKTEQSTGDESPDAELEEQRIALSVAKRQDLENVIEQLESAIKMAQSMKETAEREWQVLWQTYQARIQLRLLDILEAKTQWEAKSKQLEQTVRHFEAGIISEESCDAARTALRTSEIQRSRADAVLQFYKDIINNEPELDPTFQEEISASSPDNQK